MLGRARIVAVLVVLIAVLSACDWPMFGHDLAQTRASPDTSISKSPSALVTKWVVNLSGRNITASPTITNGIVYIGTLDGNMYAISAATGAKVWTVATGAPIEESSAAVANGIVYIGSDAVSPGGGVYAFNAATGATVWTAHLGQVWSSPVVTNGIVYVGLVGDRLVALNAATGATVWTAFTTGIVEASPTIANGNVYVGSNDGTLYAFNAATGATVWTKSVGTFGKSAAFAGGLIYVVADDGAIHALNAATGSPVWQQKIDTPNTSDASSPAIANGIVYVGTTEGAFFAFNAATGTKVWSVDTDAGTDSSPVVANGVVYTNNLWAFDAATGDLTKLGQDKTYQYSESSPTVADGSVYVGSNDGKLYAYSSCTDPEAGFGLAACDIQNAYWLPSATGGTGKTVAVIDAYNDPNADSDLAVYRSTMGLKTCTTANGCFRKVNQSGGTSYPADKLGFSPETSLDLDMVSASCPNCNILLVEANSNSFGDLATAVDTAASLGANVISYSYGSPEASAPMSLDSHFNKPGIPIVVASGDCGFAETPLWPAVIPTVTAVGGTSLFRTINVATLSASDRAYWEVVWNQFDTNHCASLTGSSLEAPGSGCSSFETAKPPWQHDSGCSHRTVADVAAVAGNLAIYDSYSFNGWATEGGTSAAAPIIAGVYALGGSTAGAKDIYAHASSLFDITSGNNGTCLGSYLCTAGTGYDGPTGLGTPCGVGAFGGAIKSTFNCAGSATAASGNINRSLANNEPLSDYVPACATPPPGYARCLALYRPDSTPVRARDAGN